jgi:hypothetical protein
MNVFKNLHGVRLSSGSKGYVNSHLHINSATNITHTSLFTKLNSPFKVGVISTWHVPKEVTKFCTVAPNICGTSLWNMLLIKFRHREL